MISVGIFSSTKAKTDKSDNGKREDQSRGGDEISYFLYVGVNKSKPHLAYTVGFYNILYDYSADALHVPVL
jgi:hypothetical protein